MSQLDREKLEAIAGEENRPEEKETYKPRPKWQLALAWIAVGIVVFAFFGTIYWMINFNP